MGTRSSQMTTFRSERPAAAPMRIDVVYEAMRRKTLDELRNIVDQAEAAGGHRGRWYKTALRVIEERKQEVNHGQPDARN